MEFEPISTTRLLALMAAGGLFACAGLYMMLRPRPEGAAKIELFGLKFESSSAGLLVFVVGAAFLATPLFVKEKVVSQPNVSTEVQTPTSPSITPAVVQRPVENDNTSGEMAQTPMPQPDPTYAKEVEPNDVVRDATPFGIGQTVSGSAGYTQNARDQDWFSLQVPATGLVGHEIRLRFVSGAPVRADVYDVREKNVGFLKTSDGAQYLPIKTAFSDKVYFRVTRDYPAGVAAYELTVLAPAPN